jgi:hypothetical protein
MSRGPGEEEELTPLRVERAGRDAPRSPAAPVPAPTARWAVGVAATVAALLLGAGALNGTGPTRQATPAPQPPPTGGDEPAPPGWRRGAPGPLFHRDNAAQVWTGTELVVWGGDPDGDSGAAYDPDADTWRAIAPAPVPARCQGATAWTGREVLIWGRACNLSPGSPDGGSGHATAGVAYDPAADRWRLLPPSPLVARALTMSVWTGSEWIVVNPVGPAAGFDPVANRWRLLAAPPRTFAAVSGHWTGREILVLGTGIAKEGPSATGASFQHWAATFDPAENRWREFPAPPLELAATGVWDGRRLIAWDQNLRAATLDPAGGGWKRVADLPVDFTDCSPQGAWLGRVVFAEHCGQGALWRPGDETWERIPHPRSLAEVPVWTGRDALFWVGRFAGSADGVWLYRPAQT